MSFPLIRLNISADASGRYASVYKKNAHNECKDIKSKLVYKEELGNFRLRERLFGDQNTHTQV